MMSCLGQTMMWCSQIVVHCTSLHPSVERPSVYLGQSVLQYGFVACFVISIKEIQIQQGWLLFTHKGLLVHWSCIGQTLPSDNNMELSSGGLKFRERRLGERLGDGPSLEIRLICSGMASLPPHNPKDGIVPAPQSPSRLEPHWYLTFHSWPV